MCPGNRDANTPRPTRSALDKAASTAPNGSPIIFEIREHLPIDVTNGSVQARLPDAGRLDRKGITMPVHGRQPAHKFGLGLQPMFQIAPGGPALRVKYFFRASFDLGARCCAVQR